MLVLYISVLEVMIHVKVIKLHVVRLSVEGLGHGNVWLDVILRLWSSRWRMLWRSEVLMRTITKVVPIGDMALSAGYDVSALLVQLWREGKLLAVENKHCFLFEQIMFALCAFPSRCGRIIHHPEQEVLDIERDLDQLFRLDTQVLLRKEILDVDKVFRHVSDLGLEGLQSDHNFRLDLHSLIVVRLMPDLLHIVKLIDLLVEVGAGELVRSWAQVVILLVVRVIEVAVVRRWMMITT